MCVSVCVCVVIRPLNEESCSSVLIFISHGNFCFLFFLIAERNVDPVITRPLFFWSGENALRVKSGHVTEVTQVTACCCDLKISMTKNKHDFHSAV